MLDQVYEIDDRGFIIDTHVEEFDEEGVPVNELPENFITVRPPDGLYRGRWTGTEWVEDKTQEEFDYDKMLEEFNPTQEQIENAEFEIRILNTLMEVGLI